MILSLLFPQTQESLNPNNLEYWMEDIYTPGYDSLLKRKEAEFRRAKLCKIGALIAAATCTVILVIVVPLCTMKTWTRRTQPTDPGGACLVCLSFFLFSAGPSRQYRNDFISFCMTDINSASAYSIFNVSLLLNFAVLLYCYELWGTLPSPDGLQSWAGFIIVARELYFYFLV